MPAFLANIGKSGDVAERSPAVISANWKEDILLQKKLVVLNRSERSVVHQIKVDQKVMYRRFQARLTCSKLAHARLMGQRQLQRQIREKNIGRLNTDIVGNTDEDFAFLDRLEQRPCTADSYTARLPELKQAKKTRRRLPQGDEEPEKTAEESLPEVNTGRSTSARARFVQTDVSSVIEKNGSDINRENVRQVTRPATSLGTRVDEEYLRHQLAKAKREKENAGKQSTEKRVEFLPLSDNSREQVENESSGSEKDEKEDSDSANDDRTDKPIVAFLEHLDVEKERPNTVANLPCSDSPVPLSPTSSRQLSRRASRASDFFHSEAKIDPISLRLREAKAVDYTDEIFKFCTELEEMKDASKSPSIDYYASRLASSFKQANTPSCDVPGTPDDEDFRCVGNLFVRSLTVPDLNWDFTGKQ